MVTSIEKAREAIEALNEKLRKLKKRSDNVVSAASGSQQDSSSLPDPDYWDNLPPWYLESGGNPQTDQGDQNGTPGWPGDKP